MLPAIINPTQRPTLSPLSCSALPRLWLGHITRCQAANTRSSANTRAGVGGRKREEEQSRERDEKGTEAGLCERAELLTGGNVTTQMKSQEAEQEKIVGYSNTGNVLLLIDSRCSGVKAKYRLFFFCLGFFLCADWKAGMSAVLFVRCRRHASRGLQRGIDRQWLAVTCHMSSKLVFCEKIVVASVQRW